MGTSQQLSPTSTVRQLREHIEREFAKVIVGQDELRQQCLMALLCRGHALIEGVPGLAKTLSIKTLSRLLQLEFRRVQATSDLMPSDIIGGNILNAKSSQFELHKGPIFTDLMLVDEINRMPPRTQGALLEGMEERQVTIDGTRFELPPTFTVFATQNPVEFEGTYPLPEAQVDRFLLKIRSGYPEGEEEIKLLGMVHAGFDSHDLDRADLRPLPADILDRAREEVKAVRVEAQLFRYITDVTRRTRTWPVVSLGASPRASVALLNVAKSVAALEGRDYLVPDDVKAAAEPVLRHRLVLKPEADLEGISADQVVGDVLRTVEVPK
jgi:MoxR-like ATPase